jgi:K+-transporting ATPase ATPase A chain
LLVLHGDGMTWQGWVQIATFAVLITASVKPLGAYIANIVEGKANLPRPLAAFEHGLYRLAGVDPAQEQTWVSYAMALLCFHFFGIAALYALQRVQKVLPLNPRAFRGRRPGSGAQHRGQLRDQYQLAVLCRRDHAQLPDPDGGDHVQSFLSAATGIAVAVALVRGFARRTSQTIGNFWVDLTRITLYVLLPICIVVSLFLVWQGVPQTLLGYVDATTLEGAHQVLARGPVASQEAIKLLGGDGGGFFNANSAHPFENPGPLSGLVEMLLIFLIGAPLTYTFGRMVGDQRQGGRCSPPWRCCSPPGDDRLCQ